MTQAHINNILKEDPIAGWKPYRPDTDIWNVFSVGKWENFEQNCYCYTVKQTHSQGEILCMKSL